ncbi:unnamed protein product [Nippostrongylus brasiliensis]|uniref:DUF1294 domain-containing protein n=1 Tax=Nippostrongylus brasiliensis TaxID=27835 RepID=A0A0N4Y1D8_NIPBR|nr:unnamed protein product [Nippostrongylus brasiliensis]
MPFLTIPVRSILVQNTLLSIAALLLAFTFGSVLHPKRFYWYQWAFECNSWHGFAASAKTLRLKLNLKLDVDRSILIGSFYGSASSAFIIALILK